MGSEATPICRLCQDALTAEEVEFYGTGCERCEQAEHRRFQRLGLHGDNPREAIALLEKELGVKGTTAVFRASLALAKRAAEEARRSALSTTTKGEGDE